MIFIAGFLVTRSRVAGIPAATVKTIYYGAVVLRTDKPMITSPDQALYLADTMGSPSDSRQISHHFTTDRYIPLFCKITDY